MKLSTSVIISVLLVRLTSAQSLGLYFVPISLPQDVIVET